MKGLLPLLALFLALPALAHEHGPARGKDGPPSGPAGEPRAHDPKEMSARMTEHLRSALKLSDDQAKKVGAIIERDAGEKLELEKKLRASERKTHEAIRALLDDEQKEKFDMMRARMMMGGRWHGSLGAHGMGGPGMNGPGMNGPGRDGPGTGEQGGGGRPGERAPGESLGPDGAQPPPPGDDEGSR